MRNPRRENRMPRFVILEHDHPTLHWDLMLEADGFLRTWRLPTPPAAGDMLAEAIADHRLAYLDYEGPVSGGRGVVSKWDFGTFHIHAIADGEIEAAILGVRIRGSIVLRRRDANAWIATWNILVSGSPRESVDRPLASEEGASQRSPAENR